MNNEIATSPSVMDGSGWPDSWVHREENNHDTLKEKLRVAQCILVISLRNTHARWPLMPFYVLNVCATTRQGSSEWLVWQFTKQKQKFVYA